MSGHEDVRCALAAEFPGWLIKVIEDEVGVCWDASRVLTPGHGGATGLHSDNATLLRELLEEAGRCDARLALRDLAARLRERGITVHVYDTNLIITGEHERQITCKRGLFRWAMRGREIGPIGHLDGAVEHIAAVVAGSLP